MSKNKKHPVGIITKDLESFNNYRNELIDELNSESIWHKQRFTQGAFWTELDSNLANQYFRDERWFFGIKYFDELKFIDHGLNINNKNNNNIGFGKTK
jgi:hypothetical protein